jgi:hypothetical protein
MPVEPHERPTNTGVFPSADHFPLGRPYGRTDALARRSVGGPAVRSDIGRPAPEEHPVQPG